MKRYSLLIQLVIYVFIMILALLGIVGGMVGFIIRLVRLLFARQLSKTHARPFSKVVSLSLLIYKKLNRQRVVWLKMRK